MEQSLGPDAGAAPGDVSLGTPGSQTDGHILAVAAAPGGQFVTGSRGGTATLHTATGEPLDTWQAHAEPVTGLCFLPDSSAVVSAGRDGTLRVWALSTGGPLLRAETRTSGPVLSVAVSPDGQLLAVGSHGRIEVRHLGSGSLEQVAEFLPAPYPINALAFSADGQRLAAGNGGDGCAWVWRLDVPTEPQRIELSPKFQIRGIRFTGDGDSLAAVDTDGNVILAHAGESARVVGRLPTRCVRQAVFLPDGRRVIIAYMDGTARLTAIPARAADR